MNGIALTVLISQLPKLFGFSIDDAGPLRDLVRITEGILGGQVNWTSFAVGAGTLAAILLLKPYKRIPGLLLAVVAATIVVGILNLDATAGVKVLGPLPQGLPSFALPIISFAQLSRSHHRWLCRRHGGVRGHERFVEDVRRQDADGG